jgi:ParB family transcriptional regulator, chromosome partitioning protein
MNDVPENGPSHEPEVNKAPARKKMGLGRGLDALLGESIGGTGHTAMEIGQGDSAGQAAQLSKRDGVSMIAVAEINPNPNQPRRHFAEAALDELAKSIARHGVIQPIVVRPYEGKYQIVAGERRWRAAQRAQIHQLPALVRSLTDAETMEIALIENIQRQDLNPIEEAEAYKRLTDEFGHSQAALASIVEKSRSHVANMMRLLELPVLLRDMVIEGQLQMGHARALLSSDDAVQLAAVVVKQGLSVRATEDLVRRSKNDGKAEAAPRKAKGESQNNADIKAVETYLGDLLGLKVRIQQGASASKGTVSFDYASLDQLDMLCQRLTGEKF